MTNLDGKSEVKLVIRGKTIHVFVDDIEDVNLIGPGYRVEHEEIGECAQRLVGRNQWWHYYF